MTEDYPFLQYQLVDGKMVYKFYSSTNETDKNAIMAKWFENSPYGISFKIKANQKGGSSRYVSLDVSDSDSITELFLNISSFFFNSFLLLNLS